MDARVFAGPWFAPGLTPPERIAKVEAHVAAMGWRVALRWRWPAPGRSWADPVCRALRLRRSWTRYAPVDACLLAHEAAHAVQAEGPLWRRVWWGLRAVFDRRFTLAIEVEAEAHELAMGRLVGVSPAARPLGGWRLFVRDIDGRLRLNLSSWTPGDPVEVQDAVVARSSELLREAAERWTP